MAQWYPKQALGVTVLRAFFAMVRIWWFFSGVAVPTQTSAPTLGPAEGKLWPSLSDRAPRLLATLCTLYSYSVFTGGHPACPSPLARPNAFNAAGIVQSQQVRAPDM
jgi:hypothetical protein